MFTCSKLIINVQNYSTFSAASTGAPRSTIPKASSPLPGYTVPAIPATSWSCNLSISGRSSAVRLALCFPISAQHHGDDGRLRVSNRALLMMMRLQQSLSAFCQIDARRRRDRIRHDHAGPCGVISRIVRRRPGDCNLHEGATRPTRWMRSPINIRRSTSDMQGILGATHGARALFEHAGRRHGLANNDHSGAVRR